MPVHRSLKISVVLTVVVAVALGLGAQEPAYLPHTEDSPCRGPDNVAARHVWMLQQRATWTAPDLIAGWQTMGFVTVSPAEITLVTDSSVCSAVVEAYNSAADLNPPADPTRDSLYVIRVGPRYDAFDPAVRDGEFIVHRIFDTAFVHIQTHAR